MTSLRSPSSDLPRLGSDGGLGVRRAVSLVAPAAKDDDDADDRQDEGPAIAKKPRMPKVDSASRGRVGEREGGEVDPGVQQHADDQGARHPAGDVEDRSRPRRRRRSAGPSSPRDCPKKRLRACTRPKSRQLKNHDRGSRKPPPQADQARSRVSASPRRSRRAGVPIAQRRGGRSRSGHRPPPPPPPPPPFPVARRGSPVPTSRGSWSRRPGTPRRERPVARRP